MVNTHLIIVTSTQIYHDMLVAVFEGLENSQTFDVSKARTDRRTSLCMDRTTHTSEELGSGNHRSNKVTFDIPY
jgi:hypothetical protein